MDRANIPLDQPECKLRSTINKLVSDAPNAQQSWLPGGTLCEPTVDDPYVGYVAFAAPRPSEQDELDALGRDLDALITGDRSAFPPVYSFPFSIAAGDLSREPTAEEMYDCSDEKHIYDLEHRISALRAERLARRKLQYAPAQACGALRRPGQRSPRARRTRCLARTAAKGTDPPPEPPGPRRPSSTTEIRRTRAARKNWSAR